MAKYVIAGKSDCPFFARAEILADELQLRLPDFSVHKIVLRPEEWNSWLTKTCLEKDWKYEGGSPMIWRELINRGGKGTLLGGCNEFLELAKSYYGIICSKTTPNLRSIAAENNETKNELDIENEKRVTSRKPFRITVVNAHSYLAYNILPLICSVGESFLLGNNKDGKNEISVSLYSDNEEHNECLYEILHGLVMELQDCALNDLTSIVFDRNLHSALHESDMVIFINSLPNLDMENLKTLKAYGLQMNAVVKNSAKVVFLGENSMMACYILSQVCSTVERENFFAISRLEENKVKSALAKQLGVITAGVSDIIVWGNSPNFIIDHSNAIAKGYNGAIWAPHINKFSHLVNEMVYDQVWLTEELPKVLNSDNNNIDDENVHKEALAMSSAFITQIHDIMNPHREGLYSLGLISKGWYGVPEGLVFSFPVTYSNNNVTVNSNLSISESIQEKITTVAENLEKSCAEIMESLK